MTPVEEHLANLRAFRDGQVTPGSPMYLAVSAAIGALERNAGEIRSVRADLKLARSALEEMRARVERLEGELGRARLRVVGAGDRSR